MKNIALILFGLMVMVACSQKPQEPAAPVVEYEYFGAEIDPSSAIEAKFIGERIAGSDSLEVKLTGTISEVCKMKGCWMTLDLENGEKMRVTFKDYGFFVPKDAAGRTVVIEGLAYQKLTPVDMLKHFAEDEGKSAEEVEAITEDKVEITYVAHGVAIVK